MNWILNILGVTNEGGRWYAFWSGAGSDIGELAIVSSLVALIRHKNCHVHRCVRLGRHPVEGTQWVVCRRHHPDDAPTHADVLAATTTRPPGGER